MQDTRGIAVVRDNESIPAWACDAALRGVRIALELLRATRLPERVVLVTTPAPARGPADRPRWSQSDATDRDPAVTSHTDSEIYIHFAEATSAAYLGRGPAARPVLTRVLAFCAGFEAALYVADSVGADDAPWVISPGGFVANLRERDEAEIHQIASNVAAIASEFTMIAVDAPGDPQTAAVSLFLSRLAEIAAEEGVAAIWRGALGHASRALIREVRFDDAPGRVATFGAPLESATELIRLVRYAAGEADWPFRRAGA